MTDTQQPELTEDGRQRRTIKSFVMRAGRMTEGDWVAFFFYLCFLVWPMFALGQVVNMMQRGAASMGRRKLQSHR